MNKVIVSISVIISMLLGITAYTYLAENKKQERIAAFFDSHNATRLPETRDLQQFALKTQHNESFKESDLPGQWSFLFFGFTHCPEFCPTTLLTMGKALTLIKENGSTQPAFIMVSVDPERDTVERLAEYIPNFSADIIGLTGDIDEITKLSKRLYASFEKVDMSSPNSEHSQHAHHAMGDGSNEDNYMMNHSSQLYIIDPKGQFFGYVKPPFKSDNIKQIFDVLHTEFSQ